MKTGLKKAITAIIVSFSFIFIFAASIYGQSILIPDGSWVYKALAEFNEAKIPFVEDYYQPGVILTRYDIADFLLRLKGQDFWPSHLKAIREKLLKEFSWEMYLLSR